MVVYIAIAVIVVVAAIIFYRKKREKEMPAGLQIFDENKFVRVDVTNRLSKLLGVLDTGFANGQLLDVRVNDGDLWFFPTFIQIENGYDYYSYYYYQSISMPDIQKIDGGISWTFSPLIVSPPSYYQGPFKVRLKGYYGVY